MENEKLDSQELVKVLKDANRIAVIKELYSLGDVTKEAYVKMLRTYLKNN